MNDDERRDQLAAIAESLPAGGDEPWSRLYKLTHLPLLRMLRRALHDDLQAEEALQSTFVTAVQRIDSFDPAKGTIDAWLAGIARYKAMEVRRAGIRAAPLAMDPVDDQPQEGDDVDGELIDVALDQLEPRYAEVLRRKFVLEQPLAQMADELDLPQGTVGTLIYRGRRRFKEIYGRLLAASEEPHRRSRAGGPAAASGGER